MTIADKKELKEILHSYVGGVMAQQDAKFDIITFKLDTITTQTTKTNGRVNEMEDCIRVIEDDILKNEAVKSWWTKSLWVMSILVGIGFIIVEIISKTK